MWYGDQLCTAFHLELLLQPPNFIKMSTSSVLLVVVGLALANTASAAINVNNK